MPTLLFLLLGLTLATCVIAYWSDNLGKKLGKKRISLLGLRPRQTATVITIGSSLIIMLGTLLSLLGIYAPLRHALFRYDAERANNRRLSTKNTQLAGSNDQLNRQKSRLSATIAAQTMESAVKTEAIVAKNAQLKQKQADLKLAEQGKQAALNATRTARGEANAAKKGAAQARSAEVQAREDFQNVTLRFNTVNGQLQGAEAKLKQSKRALHQADVQLKKTNFKLAAAERNYKTAQRSYLASSRSYLKASRDLINLTAQFDQQKAAYEAQNVDFEKQKTDLDNLKGQARQYAEQMNASLAGAAIALTGPTMILKEETLAEKTIAAHLSDSRISDALDELLRQARARVTQIGAESGTKDVGMRLVSSPQTDLEEADIEAILTRFLSNATTPVSVRVIAARTHAVGEGTIKAQLVTVPVRNAYANGENIAAATVDGRKSDAQIFNQLLALLNVGQRAAEAGHGVEPPLSRDTLFYASGTNERIFEALRRIQSVNGPARVRLQASGDASTTQPLRVDFAVARAAPNEIMPPNSPAPEVEAPATRRPNGERAAQISARDGNI